MYRYITNSRKLQASGYIRAEGEPEKSSIPEIQLTGDKEKDFDAVIDYLQSKVEMSNFTDALEDITNDDRLYELLCLGFGDGEFADVQMQVEATALESKKLSPSQSEIGLDNSLKFPLKSDCSIYFKDPVTIVAPIITFNSNYIVDGHHRWSQINVINPEAKVAALDFKYNLRPGEVLRAFQGAVAVANKDVPSQVAKVNNVFAMSEAEIKKYIEDNIQPVCTESLIKQGVAEDEAGVIEYILKNCLDLQRNNQPISNAPERDDMPQTDEKSIAIAKKGMSEI